MKDQIAKLNEAVFGSKMNGGSVEIKSEISDPKSEIILGQNIPNPFDNSTLIPFRIPKNCNDASIVISESATGKIVRVIPVTCRETQLSLDTGSLTSGTYSYSLYADGTLIQTKQMAIAR